MSALQGLEALDGTDPDAQVIICHQDLFDACTRLFRPLPVLASNGADTDFVPVFGRPVVLIGAAAQHAGILHATGSTVKVIEGEPDPFWESPDALHWAKQNAKPYEPPKAPVEPPMTEPEDMPAHVMDELPAEFYEAPAPSYADSLSPPDWRDPIDLLAPTREAARFESGWLPSLFADFAEDQAARKGVDVGIVAISQLIAAASCANEFWRLQLPRQDSEFTVRPCLWGLIVGEPSSGKSPGMEVAISPLKKIDLETREAASQARKEWEFKKKQFEAEEQKRLKDPTATYIEPPEEPRDRKLLINGATIEAVRGVLQHNDKALLFADEATSWLGSFDRYTGGNGSDRADWLQAFNGGPHAVERVGKSYLIKSWSMNVLGGTTPAALSAMGKNANDDGLMQRMLIHMANTRGKGEDMPTNLRLADGYLNVLREVFRMTPRATLHLSDGAQEIRDEFDYETYLFSQADELAPGMRSHIAKHHGIVGRLALTMHLIECAQHGVDPHTPIASKTMHNAVQILTQHQLSHLQAFYSNMLGETDEVRMAIRLAGKIAEHFPESINVRWIYRAIKYDWNNSSEAKRRACMNFLVSADWLHPVGTVKGVTGLAQAYTVNPKIEAMYAAKRAEMRDRSTRLYAKIKTVYDNARQRDADGLQDELEGYRVAAA